MSVELEDLFPPDSGTASRLQTFSCGGTELLPALSTNRVTELLNVKRKRVNYSVNKTALRSLVKAKGIRSTNSRGTSVLEDVMRRTRYQRENCLQTSLLQRAMEPGVQLLHVFERISTADSVSLAAIVASHPSLTSIDLGANILTPAAVKTLKQSIEQNTRIVNVQVCSCAPHRMLELSASAVGNCKTNERKRRITDCRTRARILRTIRQVEVEQCALLLIEEKTQRKKVFNYQLIQRTEVERLQATSHKRIRYQEILETMRNLKWKQRQQLEEEETQFREAAFTDFHIAGLGLFPHRESAFRLILSAEETIMRTTLRTSEKMDWALARRRQKQRTESEQDQRNLLATQESNVRTNLIGTQDYSLRTLYELELAARTISLTEEAKRIAEEEAEAQRQRNAEIQAQREAEWKRERERIEQARLEELRAKERVKFIRKEDDVRKIVLKRRDIEMAQLQELFSTDKSIVLKWQEVQDNEQALRRAVQEIKISTKLVPIITEGEAIFNLETFGAFFINSSSGEVQIADRIVFETDLSEPFDFPRSIQKAETHLNASFKQADSAFQAATEALKNSQQEATIRIKQTFPNFVFTYRLCGTLKLPNHHEIRRILCNPTGGILTCSMYDVGINPSVVEKVYLTPEVIANENLSCDVDEDGTLTINLADGCYDANAITTIVNAICYSCTAEDFNTPFERKFVISAYFKFREFNVFGLAPDELFLTLQNPICISTTVAMAVLPPYIKQKTGTTNKLHYADGLDSEGRSLCSNFNFLNPPLISQDFDGLQFYDSGFFEEGTLITLSFTMGGVPEDLYFMKTSSVYEEDRVEILRAPDSPAGGPAVGITLDNRVVMNVIEGNLFSTREPPPSSFAKGVGFLGLRLKVVTPLTSEATTKILSRIRYYNNFLRPVEELKRLEVSVKDDRGFVCSVNVNLTVIGKNNPTTISIPTPKTYFRLVTPPSIEESLVELYAPPISARQVPIFPTVCINDPDTDRIFGGEIRVRLLSGVCRGDILQIYSSGSTKIGIRTPEGEELYYGDKLFGYLTKQGTLITAEKRWQSTLSVGKGRPKRSSFARKSFRRTTSAAADEELNELIIKLDNTGNVTLNGIQSILRSVHYNSTNQYPQEGIRTIEVLVNLGPGLPEDAASSEIESLAKQTPVEFDHLSAKSELRITPSLFELVHQPAADIREGGSPVRIAVFEVSDTNTSGIENFSGGYIRCSIVSGNTEDDLLGLKAKDSDLRLVRKNDNTTDLFAGETKQIATATLTPSKVTIKFSKRVQITRKEVSQMLKSLTYCKLGNEAGGISKVILISLNDGNSSSSHIPICLTVAKNVGLTEIVLVGNRLKYKPFTPSITSIGNVMPIAPQGRGAITTPDDTILEGWQIVVEIATGWQKGDQLVFMTSSQQEHCSQNVDRNSDIMQRGTWEGVVHTTEEKKLRAVSADGLIDNVIGELKMDKQTLRISISQGSDTQIVDGLLISYLLNCVAFSLSDKDKIATGTRTVTVKTLDDSKYETSKVKTTIDVCKPLVSGIPESITVKLSSLIKEGVQIAEKPIVTFDDKIKQSANGYIEIYIPPDPMFDGPLPRLFFRDSQRVKRDGNQIVIGGDVIGKVTTSDGFVLRIELLSKTTAKLLTQILQCLCAKCEIDCSDDEVLQFNTSLVVSDGVGEPTVTPTVIKPC